jgi:outer membrane protein assembly factor BamB
LRRRVAAAGRDGTNWPQFRGPARDNISRETGLLRKFPAGGPKVLWSVPAAQGYAAAAIVAGPVYHHDYDESKQVWYNGQCPLLEDDRIVIATGGAAILVALDKATGKEIWRTPNPGKIAMSHSSVMPATLGGVRQYLYGTLKGPLGVSAADGKQLWDFARRFNVAVAPSPIAVSEDLVFMTGSYDAGSVMVRVRNAGGSFKAEQVFDMKNNEWNSEVHTPIVWKGHMFAVGKKRRGLSPARWRGVASGRSAPGKPAQPVSLPVAPRSQGMPAHPGAIPGRAFC